MTPVDVSQPETGWVDYHVGTAFPELAVHWVRTPVSFMPGLKRRTRAGLRDLSGIHQTGWAVVDGLDEVAQAHEDFFRRIGRDPKKPPRPPAQAMMTARLLQGEFKSKSLIEDAILIALVETGIGVTALDAATLTGRLGIRPAREGEGIEREKAGDVDQLAAGRLVIAADGPPLAAVFGDVSQPWRVSKKTAEVVLYAIRPPGVPAELVDECIEMVRSMIVGGPLPKPRRRLA